MPQMNKGGKFIFAGMKLLSIRSSNIAFTMGAYGPLIEESMKHKDEISVF